MPLYDDKPSKLKLLLLRIAGPGPRKPVPTRRSYWTHSVTLTAICFLVGLVIPAILVTSVAYFQNSLVVAQGCQKTGDEADFSFTFTCDSLSLTRVAIILACVHLAVGAICTTTAWELLKRWSRRQLDRMHERQVEQEARRRARTEDNSRRVKDWEYEKKRKEAKRLMKKRDVAVQALAEIDAENDEVRCHRIA